MYRDYWSVDDWEADQQAVRVQLHVDIDHPLLAPHPNQGQLRTVPLYLARHLLSRRLCLPTPQPHHKAIREALKADAQSVPLEGHFYEGGMLAAAVGGGGGEMVFEAYKRRVALMVAPLYGTSSTIGGNAGMEKHEQRLYKMAQRANQNMAQWYTS